MENSKEMHGKSEALGRLPIRRRGAKKAGGKMSIGGKGAILQEGPS